MARFDKGINYYTKGTAHIDVYFPEDEVKCKYCIYLRYIEGLGYRCKLTEDVIYSVEHIGKNCPIIFEGEIKEVNEKV
jgi:hypothetical protein